MHSHRVLRLIPVSAMYRTTQLPVPRARGERNAGRSRAAILYAAKRLFATQGYPATGIRDIASEAGVNLALVGRYFGAKDRLFRTVLEEMLDMRSMLSNDRSSFGRAAADLFLATEDVPSPLAIMVLSMSDAGAREISVQLLDERIIAPLADWLGGPDAEALAGRLNMLWSGFLMGWQLLPIAGLSADSQASVMRWLIETTQAIVDEAASAPRATA